jgi:hypothetical protein
MTQARPMYTTVCNEFKRLLGLHKYKNTKVVFSDDQKFAFIFVFFARHDQLNPPAYPNTHVKRRRASLFGHLANLSTIYYHPTY